ncbi:hypothetical protein DXG01_006991, partial [Tephrocybe rancida]
RARSLNNKMHFLMKTTPSRPTIIGAEMLLCLLPSCKTLAPRPHPFLALRLHPLTLHKPLLLMPRLHLLPPRKASLFTRGLHPILLHKVFLPAAGPSPCEVLRLPLRLLLLLPRNLAAPVAKPLSPNPKTPAIIGTRASHQAVQTLGRLKLL